MKLYDESLRFRLVSFVGVILIAFLAIGVYGEVSKTQVQRMVDFLEPDDFDEDLCVGKSLFTYVLYAYRDNTSEEEGLGFAEEVAKEFGDDLNFARATEVDLQRIVRDAYRKYSNDKYVRIANNEEDFTRYSNIELLRCMQDGF
jgi:hypothetical protein